LAGIPNLKKVAGEVLAGGKFYKYEILAIMPNIETPKFYFNLRMKLTYLLWASSLCSAPL
jgi:hypothetical protein